MTYVYILTVLISNHQVWAYKTEEACLSYARTAPIAYSCEKMELR